METRAEYGLGDTIKRADGALALLDTELQRFENSLGQLANRIAPISNQYDGDEVLARPREEPRSELHSGIQRLSNLIDHLDDLTKRVEL